MPFGLKDSVIKKICSIFLKYPTIDQAILYGSRAMGNYKNGSDIDLTLIGSELNLNILGNILDEIDDLLLPYSFDLSLLSQITDQPVLDHIKRVGVVFYKRTPLCNTKS